MSANLAPEVVPHSDLEVNRQPLDAAFAISPPTQPDPMEMTHGLTVHKERYVGDSRGFRGMGKWSIAALTALLTAVILGGALGGSLGSALSSCRSAKNSLLTGSSTLSSCPTTPVTSPTLSGSSTLISIASGLQNYAVASPTDIATVALDCLDGNVTETQPFTGTFNVFCGTRWNTGVPSTTLGTNGKTLILANLLGVTAYSQSNCMQACLQYNHWSNQLKLPNAMLCRSIHFAAQIGDALARHNANCWIKNGSPVDSNLYKNTEGLAVFSAALISGMSQ